MFVQSSYTSQNARASYSDNNKISLKTEKT